MKKEENKSTIDLNAHTTYVNVPKDYWYRTYVNPNQEMWIQPNQIQPLNINTGTSTFNTGLFQTTNIECHIVVNGNRKKNYNNTFYLTDKDEYSFEFFNPNQEVLGIKIKLDNDYISNSLLVINPGQRITLDRYINDAKKFLFSTYTVDDNENNKKVISNNGLISIEVFKKKQITPIQNYTFQNISNDYVYNQPNENIGTITCNYSATLDSLEPTLETGRTEKGSNSDQTFNSVNIDFESYVCQLINMTLLPISQKPIETKDLIKYCTQCSQKAKKEHNFCCKCGTKIV